MSSETVQAQRTEADIIGALRDVEIRAQVAALTGLEAWKENEGGFGSEGALRQMAALCIADYQFYTGMVEYYDANESWIAIEGDDDPCSPRTLDEVLNRLDAIESASRHSSVPRMKAPSHPGGIDG